jgi:hypothetical protein
MPHRPVILEMKVVEHLSSLPYRVALDRFVTHTRECEPCAEAFDQDGSVCFNFCPEEGHALFHRMAEAVDRQHQTSVWN